MNNPWYCGHTARQQIVGQWPDGDICIRCPECGVRRNLMTLVRSDLDYDPGMALLQLEFWPQRGGVIHNTSRRRRFALMQDYPGRPTEGTVLRSTGRRKRLRTQVPAPKIPWYRRWGGVAGYDLESKA